MISGTSWNRASLISGRTTYYYKRNSICKSSAEVEGFCLFPFYGGWWFAGYVVDHTVYTRYLIDDAAGDTS